MALVIVHNYLYVSLLFNIHVCTCRCYSYQYFYVIFQGESAIEKEDLAVSQILYQVNSSNDCDANNE